MGYLPMNAFKSRMRDAVSLANETVKGDSLRGKIINNVGWMGIGYGCDLAVRFLSSIIITRLLDPNAYGLISTVMVFLTFASMISDLGVRTMIIADERGDDPQFLGTLWTMQILRGFLIAAAAGGIAWSWHAMLTHGWIAATSNYADPMLPQLLVLIGFSVIVSGFSSLNEFRLVRHLERGTVARMDIGTRIGSTLVTVLAVLAISSVWAVAVSIVIGAGLRTILTHVVLKGPKMTLQFDRGEIMRVMRRSRWVAANSTMTFITSQADKLVIGYAFGIQVLGVYSIAFTLFSSATTLVNQLNGGMGIPVLRALADKPRWEQEKQFYRFRLPIEAYCIAAGVGMILLGPLLFKLSYDHRYLAGGTYLAFLGLKVLLLPILLSGNFIISQQRYKLAAFIGGLRSVVFMGGLLLAAWTKSIELAVLVIALERLPEVMLYFILQRTGIPFRMSRDGLIMVLVGAGILYLTL